MYVPKYYEMKDFKQIKHFMIEHNFITIITTDNSVPISHAFTCYRRGTR